MKTLILLSLMLGLSSCLKTRSELRGDYSTTGGSRASAAQPSQVGGQQQRAQIDSRFYEIDQDFRQLYGKVEELERQIADLKTLGAGGPSNGEESSAQLKKMEKRMATLEEALLAIDKKLSQMGDRSSSLAPEKIKAPFARGEAYFAQGRYEKAIEAFDEYRKNYPKGSKYADATLQMGLCFQKLKMNQDAKAFFQEVIQRYPKSSVANKAEANLKSI
jgi:TolA-binding protein